MNTSEYNVAIASCSHSEGYCNECYTSHDHVGDPMAQVVVNDDVVDVWPSHGGQESKDLECLQCRQNSKHST